MNARIHDLPLSAVLSTTLLLVLLAPLPQAASAVPSDFRIIVNAGDRLGGVAARTVTIEADGTGLYELIPVENRDTNVPSETQSFSVTEADVQCLWDAVVTHGFFDLLPEYNTGLEDGTYCEIEVTGNGETHTVITVNAENNAVDTLARLVNGLSPQRVKYNAIFGDPVLACGSSSVAMVHGHGDEGKPHTHAGFIFDIYNTTVTRNGCDITVTLNLEFSGEAANATNVQTIVDDINSVWGGDFTTGECECPVSFEVNTRTRAAGDPPTAGYHQVTLIDGGSDPDDHISTATISPPGNSGSGNWDMNEPGNTYAHEVGHLMGLQDQYVEGRDSSGRRTTRPKDGHGSDIMATLSGSPLQSGIDAIVAAGGVSCPPECCTATPTPIVTPTPTAADTDGDGIGDNVEQKFPVEGQTNLYLPDSDGDGFLDGEEDLNRNGVHREPGELDPRDRDTDGDRYEDRIELFVDGNPLDPFQPPFPYEDLDGDALPDLLDPMPFQFDTDNDRFIDGYEAAFFNGPPAVMDPSLRPPMGDADQNENWDNADAQLILNFFANLPPSQGGFGLPMVMDLGRDARIDNADAQQSLNFFAHLQPALPADFIPGGITTAK